MFIIKLLSYIKEKDKIRICLHYQNMKINTADYQSGVKCHLYQNMKINNAVYQSGVKCHLYQNMKINTAVYRSGVKCHLYQNMKINNAVHQSGVKCHLYQNKLRRGALLSLKHRFVIYLCFILDIIVLIIEFYVYLYQRLIFLR